MKEFNLNDKNPNTGEEISVKIQIEIPKIELKYGIEFEDKDFGTWCHDFLEIDE